MSTAPSFAQLNLPPAILASLKELGYEQPTPIQTQSIPILMQGCDLLAQAQTGTGKTAAFVLPILSQLDLTRKQAQAIIITPTRELAIQVTAACQSYAKQLKGFKAAAIYGGQAFQTQIRALQDGAQVIVGTPGRIMDHLRRGKLDLAAIKTVVLDEADEMLKMGFIEDVTWILDQIPKTHQMTLFSATMPASIQSLAKRYLKQAQKIQIKAHHDTELKIKQFYIKLKHHEKFDVLTRVLEVETVQAVIIFARTKQHTGEIAEQLQKRGYAAAALNGDMNQAHREKVIAGIKKGHLDIIVATDVAARGIDVARVSHVINYDIPFDKASYTHRIGRTGRAGREGCALTLVTSRELGVISKSDYNIKQSMTQIESPTIDELQTKRNQKLTDKIKGIIEKSKKLADYRQVIDQIIAQTEHDPKDIAAALVYLTQQVNPLPVHEVGDTSEPRKPARTKRNFSKKRPPSNKTFKKKGNRRSNYT